MTQLPAPAKSIPPGHDRNSRLRARRRSARLLPAPRQAGCSPRRRAASRRSASRAVAGTAARRSASCSRTRRSLSNIRLAAMKSASLISARLSRSVAREHRLCADRPFPGRHPDCRRRSRRSQSLAAPDHAVDPIGIDRVVGIEHRDPAALRGLQAGIAGAAGAAVLLERNDAHARRRQSCARSRPCRRSSNRRRRPPRPPRRAGRARCRMARASEASRVERGDHEADVRLHCCASRAADRRHRDEFPGRRAARRRRRHA